MAQFIVMPKLGLTMTEGKIVKWLKAEGDAIALGENVFDVETDKLTGSVEATAEGTLLKIVVQEDETVDCLVAVGIVGTENEDISAQLAELSAATASEHEPAIVPPPAQDSESRVPVASGGRVVVSPAAKKLAKEAGIDLAVLVGSGPNGRITKEDVEEFLARRESGATETGTKAAPKASGLASKIAAEKGVDLNSVDASGRIMAADVLGALEKQIGAGGFVQEETAKRMSGMRKIIATRMRQSVDISPTVSYDISIDVSALVRVRAELASAELKASYTDLLVYAVSRLLLESPLLNCRIEGEEIFFRNYVNLGVAVALADGLVVPVVTNAHLKSLGMISAEIRQLATCAREGTLSLDALSGGTFTVTILGMYGIESFTPIINQPEVAILGVNAIQDTPVVEDGEVVVRPLMKLSLTADHRAVDGSVAAQFLAKLKMTLEKPSLLLY
ncbi:MAG: 2-oxo acid dehydrogenase subunit E2 [Coriobacteriales bacterium]|jgi:pyruvate dehydrogenase E2 component (dihydrolipoamide acetyltransferase)|nr:2-oxo acid dehydrogenase subunit E2 [Coriobacteriales bacterium]